MKGIREEEPLAPAQLARRLRLRTPGMGTGKETKHYAAPPKAVAAAFASLKGFLEKGKGERTED